MLEFCYRLIKINVSPHIELRPNLRTPDRCFRSGKLKRSKRPKYRVAWSNFERPATGSNVDSYREVIPNGISRVGAISYAYRGPLIFINLFRAQRKREREKEVEQVLSIQPQDRGITITFHSSWPLSLRTKAVREGRTAGGGGGKRV